MTITIHHIRSGDPVQKRHLVGAAVAVALGDEDGITVYDLDTGELLASVPVPRVAEVYFLDATTLVVGADGGWASFSIDRDRLLEAAADGLTRTFTAAVIHPCPSLDDLRAATRS